MGAKPPHVPSGQQIPPTDTDAEPVSPQPSKTGSRRMLTAFGLFFLGILFIVFFPTIPYISYTLIVLSMFIGVFQIPGANIYLTDGFKDGLQLALRASIFVRDRVQQHRQRITIIVLGALCLALVLVLIMPSLMQLLKPQVSVRPLPPSPLNPIVVGNTVVGISRGNTIFDTDRIDGQLKSEAAQYLRSTDVRRATACLQLAIHEDEADGESRIYQEDQQVLDTGRSYITLVVIASLTGDANAAITGRDILQGAYIAQQEYNNPADAAHKLSGGTLVRLLIANIDSPQDAGVVAKRIVAESKDDTSIVGVIGQLSGEDDAIQILRANHIPMISSTQLSSGSPLDTSYLYSVAPSVQAEASASVNYALTITHQVAIFYDGSNAYSNSLKQAFEKQFDAAGGSVVYENTYTVGEGNTTLALLLQHALSSTPDLKLIYFPGYPSDANALLSAIHNSSNPQTRVLGGNALYQLVHSNLLRSTFDGLLFTAFFFHDEWAVLHAKKPVFLSDYDTVFNSEKQHAGNPYSYHLSDADASLAYDAASALLIASGAALNGGNGQAVGPENVWQKLKNVSVDSTIQGVSGRIVFGPDGAPENKAIVVLLADHNGNRIVGQAGRYT